MKKNTPVVNDFHTHIKKEQEILDISMKESLRQKEERRQKVIEEGMMLFAKYYRSLWD